MNQFVNNCIREVGSTLPDMPLVILSFQPDIAYKLLNCRATELILASSKPFSDKPVQDVHSGPKYPHFVSRLTRYYNDLGYYLAHVAPCTPYNEALYKHVGCCGHVRKPKDEYCTKPYKFVFVRQTGGTPIRVHHYISTSYPHHLSEEFVCDIQRVTHMLISTRWVPPKTVLDLLEDPMPIAVVVDSEAKHGTKTDKFHLAGSM